MDPGTEKTGDTQMKYGIQLICLEDTKNIFPQHLIMKTFPCKVEMNEQWTPTCPQPRVYSSDFVISALSHTYLALLIL